MSTETAAAIFTMFLFTLVALAIVTFMTWVSRDLSLASLVPTAGVILLLADTEVFTLRMSMTSVLVILCYRWILLRKTRVLPAANPTHASPGAPLVPGPAPPAAARPDAPRPADPCAGCGAGVRPGGSCAYCGRHA